MTRIGWRILNSLLLAAWLVAGSVPRTASAKGYSGGGHSYSSHSSSGGSHSYSSSSHSYSSGESSRSSSSSGSSKSFSSGSRSYSSGSSHDESNRHGYSSGKSYGAGAASDKLFSSKPPSSDARKSSASSSSSRSSRSDSGFSFDTAAARAQKEQASKSDYTKYKDSQKPPVIPSDTPSTASRPQTSPSSGGGGWGRDRDNWSYPRRTYVYVPDVMVIRTRPARIYNVFGGYTYRPWVSYNDPFSSLFWWWLLDRSIDDQAWWAYHHRYDMDPARYQALVTSNQQLEARVAQLEAQQPVARDPAYTPTGVDRDLMYSDHYVAQAYNNRRTRSGSIAFWIFGVPLAGGFCVFLIWLIWFKRWQTAT
jgi:hypothetical protein